MQADCDDLVGTTAFLAGLKKLFEKTGEVPILIHTSGTGRVYNVTHLNHSAQLSDPTGVFSFGDAWSKGLHVSEKIYYDNDPDDIDKNVPESAPHRKVDLAIIQADKEGQSDSRLTSELYLLNGQYVY